MNPVPPPEPALWGDPGEWSRRARRLGPLRYSDLGPRPPAPPAPSDELAGWLVDAADRWWDAAGRPDPFTLVVESADDGSLARRVLQLGPACLEALRYVLVHPQPAPPAMAGLLPLEEPVFLFPVGQAEDPDEGAQQATGVGPLVTCLHRPPAVAGDGAYVAIATVGRLPFDLVEYGPGGWSEIRLAARADHRDGLVEVASRLDPSAAPRIPGRPAPGRYAVLTGAEEWLRDALGSELRGVLAVVDDWTVESRPVAAVTGPPLALDQLARVRRPHPGGPQPVAGSLAAVTWALNTVG